MCVCVCVCARARVCVEKKMRQGEGEKEKYHCCIKCQEHSSSIDQEDLKGIVLQHISPSVYFNYLCVFPREESGLFISGQHLCNVGITQWLITNKVATVVS